ncbi:MFS transporter [Streptomyces sodiiphilus]
MTALYATSVVSVGGHSLTLIAIPWFVLQSTGSPGRTGLVAFCAAAPVVLSTLFGGPAIDRFGRRRTSVTSDLACGLATAAVPLLFWAGALPFWLLCALVALAGLLHAPGETARSVMLPDAAERAGTALARASGFYQGVSNAARPAGMALGGVLIAALGTEAALLIAGGVFVLASLSALALRGMPGAEPLPAAAPLSVRGYAGELREGYAFVLTTPLLLAVIVVLMFSNGTHQGWSAVLAPVHADLHLGGAHALGLLAAATGVGMALGSLVYGAWGGRLPRWPVFAVCFLVSGFPRYFTAVLDDGLLALAVVVAVGSFAAGALNPILFTVLYEVVPAKLLSRVLGVATAVSLLVTPLGGLAAGGLVEWLGLSPALLVFGTASLLLGLCPLVFPVWRQLDRTREAVPPVSAPGPGRAGAESPPSRPGPSAGL